MLDFGLGVESPGFCDPGEAWARPSDRPPGSAGRSLAALSETTLSSRFASWRGRSGKSYVFSVYRPSDCPAFCEAVLLTAARRPDGSRRLLAALDTGAFPEPVLARARDAVRASAGTIEFHLHLLARPPDERRAVLADLEAAEGPSIAASPDRPVSRTAPRTLTLAGRQRQPLAGRSLERRCPGPAPRSRGGSPSSG